MSRSLLYQRQLREEGKCIICAEEAIQLPGKPKKSPFCLYHLAKRSKTQRAKRGCKRRNLSQVAKLLQAMRQIKRNVKLDEAAACMDLPDVEPIPQPPVEPIEPPPVDSENACEGQ